MALDTALAITPYDAPVKDLYEIGEMPPLGHVPAKMYAWAIRKERHGADADLGQQALGLLQRGLGRQAQVPAQRLHQLVAHGEHRVERGHRVLKDAGDVAAADDEAAGTLGVSGTSQEGGSLTASLTGTSDADGTITGTAYQWQISDTGTSGWSNLTTGATLNAAAEVLLRAGAASVSGLAFARTPDDG